MTKQLDTKDYMVDGWDRGPHGAHPYKRGSRMNKIGTVSYTHLTLPTNREV